MTVVWLVPVFQTTRPRDLFRAHIPGSGQLEAAYRRSLSDGSGLVVPEARTIDGSLRPNGPNEDLPPSKSVMAASAARLTRISIGRSFSSTVWRQQSRRDPDPLCSFGVARVRTRLRGTLGQTQHSPQAVRLLAHEQDRGLRPRRRWLRLWPAPPGRRRSKSARNGPSSGATTAVQTGTRFSLFDPGAIPWRRAATAQPRSR